MSDFLDQLKIRVSESGRRLAEIQQKFQALQSEMQAAQQEWASWNKAAECEAKREQAASPLFHATPVIAVTDVTQLPEPEPESAASDGNKTDMVRDLLKNRQPHGMVPGDIWRDLKDQIPRPYVYSVLKRLKDRDEVQIRRGKYFYKPKPEVADQETIQ